MAPFYMDKLYRDLTSVKENTDDCSVHLSDFPKVDESVIDLDLEAKMSLAQRISSLALSLRKQEQIKVRQPLQKIVVPVLDSDFERRVSDVQNIITSEINVKEIQMMTDTSGFLKKKVKPNFKTIGPKYKQHMKAISGMINAWGMDEIAEIEKNNGWNGEIEGESIVLDMNDFDISVDDIEGYLVASDSGLTVAMDITLNEELKNEGIARELVNRIQNFRKDSGLEVTDRIDLKIDSNEAISNAIQSNMDYICDEVLANKIEFGSVDYAAKLDAELNPGENVVIGLEKN